MADQSPHVDDLEKLKADVVLRTRRNTQLDRAHAACADLGPRALEILADIAERLAKGAKQYGGDFDDKPRDWAQETYEELADGMVYSTMKLIEIREQKRADEARARAANRGKSADFNVWALQYGPEHARDGKY